MKLLVGSRPTVTAASPLSRWFFPPLRTASTKRTHRTRIISPSLCNDVLDRLEPTLRQHHGCDLIDVKPGGSLWSHRLSNAAKPRQYILVDEYKRSLKPLSEADKQQVQANTLAECLDPSRAFVSRENLILSNEKYTVLNHSLLLSANLSGATLSNSKYTGSAAAYFFNDLYSSLFGLRDNVFRHGLIRVLAWLPDDAARVLLPRGVATRTKLSLKLEAAFSMAQLAGTSDTHIVHQDRRWPDLELENWKAFEATRQNTPLDRRDGPPLPVMSSLEPDPMILRAAQYTTGAGFVDEWLALDAQLRQSNPSWFQSRAYDKKRPRGQTERETPEMTHWRDFYTRTKTLHARHKKVASLIALQRDLDARYRAHMTTSSGANDERMQSIKSEAARVRALVDSLSRDGQIQAKKAIDDYRAYDASPRALEWNKRAVDPLVVQPDEFTSKRPLALLVLTPRPSFRQTLDTDSKVTCFDYILNHLTSRWSGSIYEALERLLRGGVDEFVEMVPSLKDPVKGGWFDLTDLRVRSMPASIFLDIAVAYEKWPLRPDTTKMMFEMSRDSTFVPDD